MNLPANDLLQIRTHPLTNYCAWNEPAVPDSTLSPPAARWQPRWVWPVVGGLLVAVVALFLGAM